MTANWRPWAISAAIVIDALFLFDLLGWSRLGVDFSVFRNAAGRDLALVYPGDKMNPFVNPPTALLLFAPLARATVPAAFAAWTLANFAIFYLGLTRLFDRKVVGFALLSPIFVWAIWLGQATPLLTGIAAIGFAASPFAGGILIGAVLSVKPQLLWIYVLLIVVRRDMRPTIGVAVGALTMAGITSAVLGTHIWFAWIRSLGSFREVLLTHHILWLSPSLSAQAQPLLPMLAVPLFVLSIVLVLLAARKWPDDPKDRFTLAIAGSAFAAPYSMPHDLVGILPLAVASMKTNRRATFTLIYLNCFLALVLAAEFCRTAFLRRETAEDFKPF